MSYPTCNHLKEDGFLCGSPTLRDKKLCFYHDRDHQRLVYAERILRCNDPLRLSAPLPKTLSGIPAALFEVINALADNRIHASRAGKLLFALPQASTFLREVAK
jgi:hypothetical protein